MFGGLEFMGNKTKTNLFVVVILAVIDIILIGGYLQDASKGNISMSLGIMIAVVTAVTMAIDIVLFLLKKDGNLLKYISIAGYIVVYALASFNAKSDLVFAIAFPIIVMYVLYFDTRLMGVASGIIFAINVASVIRSAVTKTMPSGAEFALSNALLQAATIGVTGIALTGITSLENRMKNEQLDQVKTEKDKSESILSDVLSLSQTVKNNTDAADALMKELNKATQSALDTLTSIADSNSENAGNIEKQTVMTGNIQEMIMSANENASQMERIAGDSLNMVSDGRTMAERLEQKSMQISDMNSQVMDTVNQFVKNAIDVKGITEKINGISSQTNLLSLNASIESARAGEAGRGFAVVADQIRNLADETKALTSEISTIVDLLENNAVVTRTTVENVVASIDEEKALIDNSKNSYIQMEKMFTRLYEGISDTQKQLKQIVESNNVIVDSISQLSASSEEVAASMEVAVELSNKNMAKTNETGKLMEELAVMAGQLEKYSI